MFSGKRTINRSVKRNEFKKYKEQDSFPRKNKNSRDNDDNNNISFIPFNENIQNVLLEQWKAAYIEVRHFDDMILRLRLEGIPIAIGLVSVFVLITPYLLIVKIPFFGLIPYICIFIYVIGILTLDWMYVNLLTKSLTYLKDIEDPNDFFSGALNLATELNTPIPIQEKLKAIFLIYGSVMIFILLAALATITHPSGDPSTIQPSLASTEVISGILHLSHV